MKKIIILLGLTLALSCTESKYKKDKILKYSKSTLIENNPSFDAYKLKVDSNTYIIVKSSSSGAISIIKH